MNDATGRHISPQGPRNGAIGAAAGAVAPREPGGMKRAVPKLPPRPAASLPVPVPTGEGVIETAIDLVPTVPKPLPGTAAEDEASLERVRGALRTKLGEEVFASWFGRLRLDELSPSQVRLSVPTAFLKSWINNHYMGLLQEAWVAERPGILKVELVVRSAHRGPARAEAPTDETERGEAARPAVRMRPAAPLMPGARREPTGQQHATIGSPLDARYTLETFVEGPANRIALAAARAVADGDAQALKFNPLFVHAGVGLGKTHLLQATASRALKRDPAPRVVYLTAEYFMWRFATAIRDNSALDFKEQLRDIDLLVIDDMQFLQGKSIQNEFCHLLNMLLDSARQVLVAADRPPADLESLDPRVRSRLQGGMALEIVGPDYAMRREILTRRLREAQSEDASIEIAPEILDHVATEVKGSGRELEGAFNQLLFRRSFEPDLTLARVDELLGHIVRAAEPKRIRIEEIQRVVARHYNVSKQDLLSNRRTRTIVKPRQIAMYLAKTMTPRSLPEIGRRFGGRDHTTVLHAVRKIEGLTGEDNKLAQEVELLKRLINE